MNLHEDKALYYLEIVVQPYAVPISLRGRYYYRGGSTKQELTGASLNEFLLRKSGKTRDEVIESAARIEDMDIESINSFIKAAVKAGRIGDIEGLTAKDLLDNLRLTDEQGNLKRAAIVLFGARPGMKGLVHHSRGRGLSSKYLLSK